MTRDQVIYPCADCQKVGFWYPLACCTVCEAKRSQRIMEDAGKRWAATWEQRILEKMHD